MLFLLVLFTLFRGLYFFGFLLFDKDLEEIGGEEGDLFVGNEQLLAWLCRGLFFAALDLALGLDLFTKGAIMDGSEALDYV